MIYVHVCLHKKRESLLHVNPVCQMEELKEFHVNVLQMSYRSGLPSRLTHSSREHGVWMGPPSLIALLSLRCGIYLAGFATSSWKNQENKK